MEDKAFPEQVETIYFDLEQVESLASPIRSEVFWAFSNVQPLSVAEVAAGMGKSAQTVHYHVNGLSKVGLLIAVDKRKQHARLETLYVHAARHFYGRGPRASVEYRNHIRDGFLAITRTMGRENEALQRVIDLDPDFVDFAAFRRETVRLSVEKAKELRARMYELIADVTQFEVGDEGVRVNVIVYMAPTIHESRDRRKELLGGAEIPPEEKD